MVIAERDGAVLRHAVERDWPRIGEIAIACWTPIHESFRQMMGEVMYEAVTNPGDTWRERKCQQIRDRFAHQPGTVWVVELAREVVAFVTFHLEPERSVGQIGNNGVHPDQAGKGWGTFMYRHVLDHFRREGLRFAMVGTGLDWGHAPARRAYEAVGFDHAVPKVDYWQDLAEHRPGSSPTDA
jgi:GNAT superfamily N-acetyltransferase